jgi:hypothetical protein
MDTGTDTGADSGDDGQWLTYGELARIRGIDRHSAVKLVTRHRWRRQKDNRGVLRILVPAEWAVSRDKGTDEAADKGTDTGTDEGTDIARAISALQEAVATLREQLANANERADHAETGRDAERARADALADRVHVMQVELAKAEAEGNSLTIETAELTAQVKAAKAEAREAQDRAEAAERADAARRGRGRLARLRAAWRGL